MEIASIIISVFGGSVVLLGAVGFLGKSLINNLLKKDIEILKKEHQLIISKETRKSEYKKELAIRQLDAAQEMWCLFGNTSLNAGNSNIIEETSDGIIFYKDRAKQFITSFNNSFNGKSGLYISSETRKQLHCFRNLLIELCNTSDPGVNDLKVDVAIKSIFKYYRTEARLALRTEIGSRNLRIANKNMENEH
jgi:hypothetical protein